MSFDSKIAETAGLIKPKANTPEKKSNQLNQDDFLKMIIAQMKYQNPLEPQDAGKYMDQMTQMSSMQGMQDMQASFKNMVDSMGSGQIMQASSLVGRSVMVPGTSGNYLPGSPLRGEIVLPKAVSSLKVEISDASGKVVKTMNLGEQKEGAADISWDGDRDDGTQAKAGFYSVKATATVEGKPVSQEVRMSAAVSSVNVGKTGVALNLQDGRQFSLNDVSEIF